MSDASWGNLGAKVKRNVRINTVPAIIGDETGAIYHPYLPGYVWVRQQYANGYGKAFPVLGPAGNSIVLNPGTRVGLAQTSDNKLKVEALDVVGGSIDGTNLYQSNVPQLPSGTFVAQQSFITALVIPQQIPDLTVTIKSWIIIANGIYYEFPGVQDFDVSASVPSAGNNRFAVVFLDNDYLTPRVTASTPRLNTDLPLGAADVQECITAAPSTSTPLAAIRLYGGQTQVLNADIIHDLRQLINVATTTAPTLPVNVTLRVVTAAGAATVTTSDYMVVINKTVGAATVVNLPAGPTVGDTYLIKDGKGDAAANNITLTPAAGTIDGAGTYVISQGYESITVVYNGTEWNIA